MRKWTLYLLYVMMVASDAAIAQTIVSKPIPFSYELISNEIWNFSQDRQGYIWVATTGGIARYDGHQLNTFRNDYRNPHLLADNDVTIVTDSGPLLWVGTRKGITLIDKSDYRFFSPKEQELQNVDANEIITHGTSVWINGNLNLAYRCSQEGSLIKKYDFRDLTGKGSTVHINNIYVDREDRLWAVLGEYGIACYDPGKDSFIRVPLSEQINCYVMYQDADKNFWISTWGNGLYSCDMQTGTLKRHHIINSETGKEDLAFFSMMQDDVYGYLWLLSYNSLYIYRVQDGGLIPVDLPSIIKTHKMYTRIFKDREGNLWLSSYDDAYIISFDKSEIRNYTLPKLTQTWGWDANILDVSIDDDRMIWLIQDRYGLCLYDPEIDKLDLMGGLLPYASNSIRLTKSRHRNSFWLNRRSTSEIFLVERDGWHLNRKTQYELSGVDPLCGNVDNLLEDADGNLWVHTTQNKIFVCSGEGIVRFENQDKDNYILQDRNKNIWKISSGGKISRLHLDGVIREKLVSKADELKMGRSIRSAQMDKDGRIWGISEMGAVYRTDVQKSKIEEVNVDNLLDDCVPLMLLADKDHMWIVTNKKIVRYNYTDNGYAVYSVRDENIQIDLFRNQAAVLDGEGGLYAGGHNGFIHIAKQSVNSRPMWEFEPVVSGLTVNNQIIYINSISNHDRVELTSDARNIEIQISLLVYGIGWKPRVAYMLEGTDKDWSYLSPEKHSAFYNKLDKGTYHMRIKYEYEPGRWSESKVLLTIVQLPAWFETWWAYIIYTLIFFGFVYLLLVTPFERSKLKRKIEELVKKNLHHEAIMSKVSDQPQLKDADEELLKRLIREIEDHIMESEYDLSGLADSLGMSKSTLNRKVKTLTDMTPFDFIRSIRMKRARQLLASTQLSVSEIAYSTGFTNPKYFTKCFKQDVGCTPSEYKQRSNDIAQKG